MYALARSSATSRRFNAADRLDGRGTVVVRPCLEFEISEPQPIGRELRFNVFGRVTVRRRGAMTALLTKTSSGPFHHFANA
jgi:hypothetical protein